MVDIYAFHDDEPKTFKGLINYSITASLEKPLILKINPPWNIANKPKKADQAIAAVEGESR